MFRGNFGGTPKTVWVSLSSEGLALGIIWSPKWSLWLISLWGMHGRSLWVTPLRASTVRLKLLGLGINPLLNLSLEAPTFPWVRYSLTNDCYIYVLREFWRDPEDTYCESLGGKMIVSPSEGLALRIPWVPPKWSMWLIILGGMLRKSLWGMPLRG